MVPDDAALLELQLRFREHSPTTDPPALTDFCRAPERDVSAPPPPDAIGVLPRSRRRAPARDAGNFVLFFQLPEFPIPAPVHLYELPDLSSWSISPTVFGWSTTIPQPTLAKPGLLRTAGVLAACVTLMVPFPVIAAPAADDAAVPRPAETPTAIEAPTSDPAPETPPPPEPEPVDAGVTAPSPPSPAAAADTTDPAVIDAAWEGVDGFNVVLEIRGGETMRGRVGAVQRDTFTLIEATTGTVRVLPKSGVLSLRVYVPPPIPEKNGVGLLVGGGILSAMGTPVFITGAVFLGFCPSCAYFHLPMLLIGGAALGAGIPMIVKGSKRRRAFNNAIEERRLTPIVGRTTHGWSGGLRFQF